MSNSSDFLVMGTKFKPLLRRDFSASEIAKSPGIVTTARSARGAGECESLEGLEAPTSDANLALLVCLRNSNRVKLSERILAAIDEIKPVGRRPKVRGGSAQFQQRVDRI